MKRIQVVLFLVVVVCWRSGSAGTITDITHITHLANSVRINDIAIEGDSVWVGTNTEGLFLCNLESETVIEYKRVDSGLPLDSIIAIAVDLKNKRRWVATAEGLVQIESQGCHTISLPHGTGSPGAVSDIAFDSMGRGWIAIRGKGIFSFRDGEWHDVLEENPGFPMKLVDGNVKAFLPGCDGEMWFLYTGRPWYGLARFRNGDWLNLSDEGYYAAACGPDCGMYALRGFEFMGIKSAFVKVAGTESGYTSFQDIHPELGRPHEVTVGPDATVYFFSNNALFSLKDTLCNAISLPYTFDVLSPAKAANDGSITTGARHIDGTTGVARFVNGSWQFHALLRSSIPSNDIVGMGIDPHDNVWITHENRISVYRDSVWHSISVEGLGVERLTPGAICFDKDGCGWVFAGSTVVAIAESADSIVLKQEKPGISPNLFFNPLLGNEHGEIVVVSSSMSGTRDVGNTMPITLARRKGDNWDTRVCECALLNKPKPIITAAAMDDAGAIWLHIGFGELKKISINNVCTDIPLLGNRTTQKPIGLNGIATCAGGSVYVGTDESSIIRIRPDGQDHIPFGRPVSSYASNNLVLLGCDSRGRLWFDLQTPYADYPRAGNVGLCMVDKDPCVMGIHPGLPPLRLAAFNSRGDMWVSTYREGLYVLHGIDSAGSIIEGNRYVEQQTVYGRESMIVVYESDGSLYMTVPHSENLSVRVYNTQGRILGNAEGFFTEGRHTIRMRQAAGWSSGVVMVRISGESRGRNLRVPIGGGVWSRARSLSGR